MGTAAAHLAAQNGRPASIRRLLAHGADPDLRDPLDHRTPPEWCQPGNRYLASPAHDEAEAILRPATGHGRSLILVPWGRGKPKRRREIPADGKKNSVAVSSRAARAHDCRFPLVRQHMMRTGAGKPSQW